MSDTGRKMNTKNMFKEENTWNTRNLKENTLNIYLKHWVLTLTTAIRVAPTQDDAGPCWDCASPVWNQDILYILCWQLYHIVPVETAQATEPRYMLFWAPKSWEPPPSTEKETRMPCDNVIVNIIIYTLQRITWRPRLEAQVPQTKPLQRGSKPLNKDLDKQSLAIYLRIASFFSTMHNVTPQ